MTMCDNQDMTIAFLSSPASYNEAVGVERMETHISAIFLAGDRVFKLKKSLKLPYVDFSTPEIREEACRKEVALNSITAPGLYIGTQRITLGDDGLPCFDGDGPLLDAVVVMSRFDQQHLLDNMARNGQLTPALMTETARMISACHKAAPVVNGSGGAANIAAVLDINDAGFATGKVFSSQETAELGTQFRAALAQHSALLDARADAGMIRRCHGDLHLRNICLLDGRPCLFDCIEFNDQIATIDVLYDLAFLLMDLWHRDLPDLASLVANRYFDATDDEEGYGLLPFFMAIRAAVRAHVTATQASEPGQDRDALAASARSFFDLARSLLAPQPARLVIIGGLSGSGKSTVADAVAPVIGPPPGARVIESDRIRKALHDVTATTRLPASAYSSAMSEKVYAEMAGRARAVLSHGGPVIADAVFDTAEKRFAMEQAGQAASVMAETIWLDASAEILAQRVASRVAGQSDADATVLTAQLARHIDYSGWTRIDATRPLEDIVRLIGKTP